LKIGKLSTCLVMIPDLLSPVLFFRIGMTPIEAEHQEIFVVVKNDRDRFFERSRAFKRHEEVAKFVHNHSVSLRRVTEQRSAKPFGACSVLIGVFVKTN